MPGRISILSAVVLVLGAELLFSCKPKERSKDVMSSTTEDSNAILSAPDESWRFAQGVLALKEIPLPDEWYSVEGATVTERLEAASRAMRKVDANAPNVSELMARYDNGGRPFVHSVWFNQPLLCPKCGPAGAQGFYTITSIKKDLAVTIGAKEMHDVMKHQGSFTTKKLEILKRILTQE